MICVWAAIPAELRVAFNKLKLRNVEGADPLLNIGKCYAVWPWHTPIPQEVKDLVRELGMEDRIRVRTLDLLGARISFGGKSANTNTVQWVMNKAERCNISSCGTCGEAVMLAGSCPSVARGTCRPMAMTTGRCASCRASIHI